MLHLSHVLLLGLGSPGGLLPPEERLADLMVGDAAPKLEVGRWVQGKAVGEWERGEVYVVDLWATWCEPCIRAMPHLTEVQKAYGDELKIIAVSIGEHDPSLVEPLVERMGSKMELRVAQDLVAEGADRTEGAVFKDWLTASGRSGIPLSFLVNRSGSWQTAGISRRHGATTCRPRFGSTRAPGSRRSPGIHTPSVKGHWRR